MLPTRLPLQATLPGIALLLLAACGDATPGVSEAGAESTDAGASRSAQHAEDAEAGPGPQVHPTDADTPTFVPLIDHTDWQPYEAALDALADHQPTNIDCGIAGYFVEEDGLEVDTGRCAYLLVEHAARADVEAGSELRIELRHFDLTAAEPASAHLALLAGDDVQWETTLEIPSSANVLHATVTATRDIAIGEPIRFHLHNHGQNTYLLVAVEVAVPRSR